MKLEKIFICFAALLFFGASCAAPAQIKEGKKMPVEQRKLTLEEQEKAAFLILNEILGLTEKTADRQAILPQMEALYEEIIDRYPDVQIAEESYFKVIIMDIEEFTPPRVDKAEKLYRNFFRIYPTSPFNNYIEQAFGRFFYKNKMWHRLMGIFIPQIKKFIQTGKLGSPYPMFMYSEAKFNLGDLAEAEKGYKIVMEFYPKTKEGENSKNRLNEIHNLKKQRGGS